MSNECAIKGCGLKISKKHLMCLPHWLQVPAELQEDVNRTYRALRDRPRVKYEPDYSAWLTAREAYLDAVTAAAHAIP